MNTIDQKTLTANHLVVGYEDKKILSDVSVTLPQGKISVILGSNGCGKSTLLKTLARLLKPESGEIYLDGKSIHRTPSKKVAQKLGLLPQTPITPKGIKVIAEGEPHKIIDAQLIKNIYGLNCTVMEDPISRTPMVIPIGRKHSCKVYVA